MSTPDPLKQQAAEASIVHIQDGMVIGLGTGSTAALMLEALGRRVQQGLRIVAIPTSERTGARAAELGIKLVDFATHPTIDLTIDGADEVHIGTLDLIKGLGGALLREKIVASASRRMTVIVDGSKLVPKLGGTVRLPVEIVPFGWQTTAARLRDQGADAILRGGADSPYRTDGGNLILDCAFPSILDAATLQATLKAITGVVETGLFIGLATTIIAGTPDGLKILEAPMTELATNPAASSPKGPVTLTLDIGGTGLKAGLLDADGHMIGNRARVETPHPSPPDAVLPALVGLAHCLGAFDRVSVGFPGVVRGTKVLTAPNLGTELWAGYDLAGVLADRLGRPVRLLNDATVQGLGVISGRGLECVITLGTGFGFALYQNGHLGPHLEMSQHVIRGAKTYDEYLGVAALQKIGKRRWRRRVQKMLTQLRVLVNWDTLYIGGGDARLIDFVLPTDIRIISNNAGITGGVRLWDLRMDADFADHDQPALAAEHA